MTIKELIQKDNTFNESEFISKADNIFIMILSGIMTENIEKVKHKLSHELYKKYEDYIKTLKIKNQRQMYGDPNIKQTKIEEIIEEENEYIIKVLLVSRYMNYIINKETKKIITGNNGERIEIHNHLTFVKSKQAKEESIIKKCPNCGASMNTSSTGICEFCHGTYDTFSYDWILTNIERR